MSIKKIKLILESMRDIKEFRYFNQEDVEKYRPKESLTKEQQECLDKLGFKKYSEEEISPDPEQLKMGIEVEQEHTTNKDVARTIALAHLSEISDYYTRLKKMESEAGIKESEELHYNYEDSSEISKLIKELEKIEDNLYYLMNDEQDSREVREQLKPFIGKLKSFLDRRE